MSTTVDRTQESAPRQPAPEIVRVSVPQRSLSSELRAIRIVWRRELIRFKSDRLRIVTSLVQPLLFLFVLGSGCRASPTPAPTASTSRRSSTPGSSASR